MGIIESLTAIENCEPRICVWCAKCGMVLRGGVWGYVCTKNTDWMTKRHKGAIMPFPVGTEGRFRVRVQCVERGESHDCFEPTKLGSRRMQLMDVLGLLEET